MEFEVVASGLGFPEGPVIMEDGSVIIVEIQLGCISRIWGEGKREVIATPGGGPNGLAIGPDGALYCCNNGGFEYHNVGGLMVPGNCPPDYSGGRIERIDLTTGKVERLYDSVDGNALRGPNDIVFDAEGGFYFTDLGKGFSRTRDHGGVYYARPDGSFIKEVDYHHISPNGCGLSPDGKTLYFADTMTARLWAFALTGPGEYAPHRPPFLRGRVITGQTELCYFDSLGVAASGNVCVATILKNGGHGGITTITPEGKSSFTEIPDPFVTNIAFGGKDMKDAYITASGTGQLIRCRWPEAGLSLNYNA
ncbi:MAG: SMP-30/gluconolactonase/LRE family protein [Hyphomonas sp.]